MSDKPDSQVFCPDCNERLQKCLIQQNYAIIICPSLVCGYHSIKEKYSKI
ncbi:CGH_3_HP_G0025570.mRNA.1.CDS.1 [Saccharomyces cerevisiae]|nr:CGH_3_HP_G0025570.mRNA.1.CDS.1 [Saccharomyces cerevisiae]CAI4989079.1 CGH_1_HP_G0065960.mRNA.1.CDS.1 [Saccharomyces cerevisiae]CAI5023258.1 CGH_1_HP_G0094930.mRNA.1.CDS.1 [Saccharomyces cerevisiae]CAI5119070.1 CGH_1_HP_G0134100.mRNA.1.CDS.1 [Saccharomyces cerevisiae]CAI6437016.1 CGH_3_HP_G0025570.mRNA.1.CDS.1 [Saccharomyces cerevisiae]